MSELISGIHHVALKCAGEAEFSKTIAFYRDVLGLSVIRRWGDGDKSGIMLSSGNGLIEILANADKALSQGAVRHFALATRNVDACAKAVREAGYEVFVEPKDIVIASKPEFPARIAFCTGPVGEQIEFFEER